MSSTSFPRRPLDFRTKQLLACAFGVGVRTASGQEGIKNIYVLLGEEPHLTHCDCVTTQQAAAC